MKIELMPPSQGDLLAPADVAVAMANEIVIDSQEMADAAAEELRLIAKRKDALDKQRKELTSPLDEFKKKVMDLFRPAIDRYTEAEGALKRGLLRWNDEQAKLRALEDLRRREAAEAERRRLEEEAEAARKLAEAAAAAGDIAAAEQAAQVAEQAQMMTELVIAPTASTPAPKVEGTSIRKTVDYQVVDFLQLIQWVAANPTFHNLLEVDATAMRAYVRAIGANGKVPGVRIFEKQTLATSRR